jgi:hypothetical protein
VIGLFVLTVLAALVLVGGSGSSERLDPQSHEDQGTSALLALLEELGADVTLDVQVEDLAGGEADAATLDGFDVVLVLRDTMDDATRRDQLRPWVTDGGTLVVADPRSPLVPLRNDTGSDLGGMGDPGSDEGSARARQYADLERFGGAETVDRDVCTIDGLQDVDVQQLRVEGQAFRYPMAPEYQSCFGSEREAFVVAKPRGEGTEISLGSAGVLTNEALANQSSRDNAVLLAELIAPTDGVRVAVIEATPLAATGEESLWDLVPTWVKLAGAQLLVAFVVFALWRSRRLGRPVAEPQPVKVASSELVAAVGGLLQRTGSPQHAAEVLRADLRRDLLSRLGLEPDLPPQTFFQVVESAVSLDPAALRTAVGPGPVTTDQELLAVMHTIDAVRKEVFDSVGTGS